MFIKSWADEYDSDMENDFTKNKSTCNQTHINSKNKDNENDKKIYKFSYKICSRRCSLNYNLFTIVENSEYSCLMPWYVYQVNNCLDKIYKEINLNKFKINKIVDAGANIGVDSINFLYNFPNSQLISFEIDNKTYKALCKNLLEFNNITNLNSIKDLENSENKVQAYNKDFLLNLNKIKNADIVFIDAPWGGKIYKDKKSVSIYLQPENDYYNIYNYDESKNIISITKTILQNKYNVKSVILKVPYNYEFKNLENEIRKLDKQLNITYKNIYKGNSSYIAFVLIFIYI